MTFRRLIVPIPALAALAAAGCTPSTPPQPSPSIAGTPASSASASPSATPSPTTSTSTAPSASASPAPEPQTVWLYFVGPHGGGPLCQDVVSAAREIPAGIDPVREAMRLLVAGPDEPEAAEGLGGAFSAETAGTLNIAHREGDTVYVDFDNFAEIIPNSSTSCGSASLFAQLDTTVVSNQHDVPAELLTCYSFDGELAPFYEWLQQSVPNHCDQSVLDSLAGG